MMMLSLALMSLGSYAQHDHGGHAMQDGNMQMEPKFKNKYLGIAYFNYLSLKDALVASDKEKAKQTASQLDKSLEKVEGSKKAQTEAGKISNATSLEDQRLAFNGLSNEMADLVKNGKLSMGEIYLEYCPMANNNEGAFWLSNQKDIRNPYLGDRMLKCGSIKETIN